MRRKGFTLIELLIVIAIIAILAAIAIPQFARYRIRAYNGSAESDLRNVRTTFEAFFADWQVYPNAASAQSGQITLSNGNRQEVIQLSTAVNFIHRTDPNAVSYVMITKHTQGDTYYGADSDVQGIFFQKNNTFIGAWDPSMLPGTSTPQTNDFGNQWTLQ